MNVGIKVILITGMALSSATAFSQCVGSTGPGGACSTGPGGGLSTGPGGGLSTGPGGGVIIPFLTDAKNRCHAAISILFGGKPPLALLGRSLL